MINKLLDEPYFKEEFFDNLFDPNKEKMQVAIECTVKTFCWLVRELLTEDVYSIKARVGKGTRDSTRAEIKAFCQENSEEINDYFIDKTFEIALRKHSEKYDLRASEIIKIRDSHLSSSSRCQFMKIPYGDVYLLTQMYKELSRRK